MPLNVRNIDIRGLISYTEGAAPAPSVPVASFTATPTSGTATLTVSFTDTSTNSPTSWLWDFKNDGTATSTQQNSSYEYTQAGTYSVKLSATNSAGTGVTTSTNLITVSSPVVIPNQYTTLQLPGTGTNNANNNTFLDSSSNNFTITRVGNTTQGTFTPYSDAPGYWSNYFDGTGDYLSVASNAAFSFGTGDFTVEGWFYLTSNTGAYRTILNIPHSGGIVMVRFGDSTSYNSCFQVATVASAASNVYSINQSQASLLNQWVHFAFTRSSSTCRVFINGVQQNLGTGTNPASFPNSSFSDSTNITNNGTVGIGDAVGVNIPWQGYLSNIRIVKDTAVYTSNFTPSTTPLTAVSGTSLLTSNNNRFMDSSSNNFTVTRVGDTRVQSFGPFTPARAYSTSVVGGSMYVDGTGDYLTVPNSADLNLGSSNFTIECWFYPTATPSASGHTLFAKRASTAAFTQIQLLFVSNLTPQLYASTNGSSWGISNPTASVSCQLNSWNHIAVTRSGDTYRLFINGQVSATATLSGSLMSNAEAFSIAAGASNGGSPINASYISNFRIVKGTAVYTAAFTPPTAPLTAVSDTSLLLSGTNAAIYDASMSTIVETAGGAKISTTISASGSMYFDGTGDYLVSPSSTNFGFGTGDFTMECWLYLNSTAEQTVMSCLTNASSVAPHFYISPGGTIVYYTASANRITGSTLVTSTWYHLALSRSGSSTKMFINGTQVGSTYTDTNNYGSTAPLGIGTYWSGGSPVGSSTLNGYLNDVRITKGTAVYTANFTPPTRS
jgi:PKD repeat protein